MNMRYHKDFNTLAHVMRRKLKHFHLLEKPSIMPFAKSVKLSVDTPDAETFTFIPNYREEPIGASPEQKAEPNIDFDNVIDVDASVIEEVKDKSTSIAKEIQNILLNEGASLLISYDDASSYAQAALRDGMGIDANIDSSISSGLSHLMKLNIINTYMNHISLPDDMKSRFMRLMTAKIAGDVHDAMNKTSTSEKYSSMLQNLQARVKGGKTEGSVGHSTPVGVVRNRSNRPSPSDNSSSDVKHGYNMDQNQGVRMK